MTPCFYVVPANHVSLISGDYSFLEVFANVIGKSI